MTRAHRRGVVEKTILAPLPFVRPFLCSRCQFRGLRFTKAIHFRDIVFFLVSIAAGALVLQLIWLVRTRAPGHPGAGYEPKDLERERYLEQKKQP